MEIKKYIILITYTAFILYLSLNFNVVINIFNKIFIIFMPFIYGFAIAYVINRPYEFFRKKFIYLASRLHSPKTVLDAKTINRRVAEFNNNKWINISSVILSYSVFLGLILFIIVTIVPQLFMSINQFIDNFSRYSSSFITWSNDIEKKFKLNLLPYNGYTETLIKSFANISEKFVSEFFPGVFSFTKNFAIGVYNWIIGLIVSLYLIGSKEKLIKQIRILAYSYIPPKFTVKIFKIIKLMHENFGKFLIGKIIDSLIIGALCFIGTSVLKIPYTLLISTIVTITNIIPFFGPFIGSIPCIIMLLIVDHVKALWFTAFIFILQQIDANIIGPKVLGNTVGISGFWILFSVIIGGGIFGISGMILGVPIFAVIYTIISEYVHSYRSEYFAE